MSWIVDGKEISNSDLVAMAKDHGISKTLLRQRLLRNLEPKKAATHPSRPRQPVVVNGQEFQTANQAREMIGTTTASVFYSRKSAGHSLEICLGLEPLHKEVLINWVGGFLTISHLAEELECPPQRLKGRLGRMSVEQAVDFISANGCYGKTFFENHPLIAAAPGRLYWVILDMEEGYFLKIGTTFQPLESRLQGVNYKEILVIEGPLEWLYDVEQEIRENSV